MGCTILALLRGDSNPAEVALSLGLTIGIGVAYGWFLVRVLPEQNLLGSACSMEIAKTIRQKIHVATTSEDVDVRAAYLSTFDVEIEQFVEGMAKAFERWQKLDEGSSAEPRRAYASALVYSAITLHISSMNLFLSGWLVAAGNLQRQVLESIALAFLVSARHLRVLEQYSAGSYSSSKAPGQLLRHHASLGLNKEAVEILNSAIDFYHNWSHANLMTIATHMQGKGENIYVGAAFDENRREQYQKEARGRANLASVFENFVIGIHSLFDRNDKQT